MNRQTGPTKDDADFEAMLAKARQMAVNMPQQDIAYGKQKTAKLIGGNTCYKMEFPNTCRAPYNLRCSVFVCCKDEGCGKTMC